MAPSAPKTGYCQADFFCATFSKKLIFWGSRKTVLVCLSASYFRDPFWDPSASVPYRWNEADGMHLRVFEAFSVTHKQTDNIKQTRTSYLGTGVAD